MKKLFFKYGDKIQSWIFENGVKAVKITAFIFILGLISLTALLVQLVIYLLSFI